MSFQFDLSINIMKKAILLGATGYVGAYLLEELLHNKAYDKVTIITRKDFPMEHPKLDKLIGDYDTLPAIKAAVTGDDIFIAIGTTKSKTPDRKQYYQIDHDYPVLAARIAKENGATAVFLVTAVSSNADSKIFYIKTKGETERDIVALDFEHTHIFRPSMIMGQRKEKRIAERIFQKIWSVIDPLFAGKKWSKYKGILGKDIARAMNAAGTEKSDKLKIYHWQEMKELLNANHKTAGNRKA